MTSPLHPADRKRAFRPILAWATLLMVALMLAGCLSPGAGRPAQPVAEPPPAEETSPAEQSTSDAVTPPAQETPPPVAEEGPAPPAPEPVPPAPAELPPAPTEEPAKTIPSVPNGELSQLIAHGDRACKKVALTYDAGSGADGAEAILDTLKKHNLKVTFFLTGRWVEKYPELAKRIADDGHEVGNHTYSHPDLTKLADDEVIRQVADAEAAIRKATGKDPRPLFREPYGAFSDHERKLVRQAGYAYSIYWDVDTLDWQFPGAETLVSRIMKARGGSIVLMHLNVADTALASDQAIPQLKAQGYEIVTVSDLLQCKGQ